MISIFANWKNPVEIENLEIDTILREEHRYQNNITNYPIEKGVDISDHIQQQPEILILEGITSNTPVRFVTENFKALLRTDGSNRMQLAFDTLLRYAGFQSPKQQNTDPETQINPSIMTIVTGNKVYTNMVISNLTFPRSSTTGQVVQFTVEFKKIKLVESEYTIVDKTSSLGGKAANIENQGSKTRETGKQTPKEEKQGSTLYNGTDWVIKKLGGSGLKGVQ